MKWTEEQIKQRAKQDAKRALQGSIARLQAQGITPTPSILEEMMQESLVVDLSHFLDEVVADGGPESARSPKISWLSRLFRHS